MPHRASEAVIARPTPRLRPTILLIVHLGPALELERPRAVPAIGLPLPTTAAVRIIRIGRIRTATAAIPRRDLTARGVTPLLAPTLRLITRAADLTGAAPAAPTEEAVVDFMVAVVAPTAAVADTAKLNI